MPVHFEDRLMRHDSFSASKPRPLLPYSLAFSKCLWARILTLVALSLPRVAVLFSLVQLPPKLYLDTTAL